jgi:putative transposase
MAPKRYELTEKQWVRISPLIAGKASDPGRTGADNRLFVNAVLWVIRSGAHWHDLPERYGKYKSVHKRFTRWAKAGVWEWIFEYFRPSIAHFQTWRSWASRYSSP